ncbi:hypothetical protein JXA88_18115 [Candidatus Fermentibacteria bacterium]|nr:hypothetical protein [Candidatus Fermentibacteria bacterium]
MRRSLLVCLAGLFMLMSMPASAQFPVFVDFENGGAIPPGWTNDAGDSGEDWLFQIPSGTSSNPCSYGATVDHTADPGQYVAWVDDSTPTVTPTNLISPAYDITSLTDPGVSFYYWIGRGAAQPVSNLVVDVYDGSVWHNDVVTVGASNGWSLGYVDLTPYVSVATQIRFRAMESSSFYYDICLDDITIADFATPPGCASPMSPADMATDAEAPDGSLNWSAAAGATGYYLYFGSDGGGTVRPTNIVNGTDLGNVTTYPYTGLDFSTTYYWEIVPYNGYGSPGSCDIWEFTTIADPNWGSGGGYYFANSLATAAPSHPVYNWIDISATGTYVDLAGTNGGADGSDGVLGDDDWVGPYDFGFTFPFMGTDYTQFCICSNGKIYFGDLTGVSESIYNGAMGTGATIRPAVYWMGQDLNANTEPIPDRAVYYGAGGGGMVVTFWHCPEYNATNDLDDHLTAQVIIYPNGNIKVQYNEDELGPTFNYTSDSHVVGIVNQDGLNYIEYRRLTGSTVNTPGPLFGSNLALMFGPDQNNVPVELSSFSGVGGAGFAQLRWETATEHENLGYYLLRKAAGVEAFARVNQDLIQGAGTTLDPSVYQYRDEGLTAGTYLYKLVDVSFDGATAEHGPLTVSVGEALPFAYSIQAKNGDAVEFRLSLPAQTPMSLKVYDLAGREVWTLEREDMAPGTYTIAWPGLTAMGSRAASSTYVYRVRCGDAFVQTGKVVLLR